MVFEHAQLLVAPPEAFDACVGVLQRQFCPAVSFALVQDPQILFRGAGRLAVVTRWPTESAASLLGTQVVKSIWAHLQFEHGVRLGGITSREFSVPRQYPIE